MLTEPHFQRAASQLNWPVAHVKAVCEVEAPRGGFTPDGQPRILFEAHKFSQFTNGAYDRSHPLLSSRSWNRALYAVGADADIRSMREHHRLGQAVALDRNAALRAASWGLFQILGDNHRRAGHESLQSFINAMYRDEEAHLDAFIAFVRHDRVLLEAGRRGDWKTFSRIFNGPAYAQNAHDIKLSKAAKAFGA